MPKYNLEEDKPAVADKPKASYNLGVKSIQSVFSAHLKYVGVASGKLYEWDKAGAIVAVDEADVDDLLSKRIGERGCCGGNENGNILFQLA